MKKLFAMMMVIALVAFGTTALGDDAKAKTVTLSTNASGFQLSLDLPDGASVSMENHADVPYTFIRFQDPAKPLLYISVAPTEEYTGVTLDKLTKGELDQLFETFSADLEKPSYEMGKTAHGYTYMLISDDSEEDSETMVTLYQSYFIQLTAWNSDYDILTDDDINTAVSLLDTIKVIPD